MTPIRDIKTLERLYGEPAPASVGKVVNSLTPLYAKWIAKSRFCILTTVGPNGTDGSPRGDVGPVVTALDQNTLLMPDWRGNNRMDSLRNIVADSRLSIMFMVSGSNTVVRLNGSGIVTTDVELTNRFSQKGQHPRSVIVITIHEIYTQCARATIRSEIWTTDVTTDLPTVGELLAEATEGQQGGKPYDDAWQKRSAKTMW